MNVFVFFSWVSAGFSAETPTRTMCLICKWIQPATVETPRKFEKLKPNIVGLTWHAWNVSQIVRIHLTHPSGKEPRQ